VNYSDKLLGFDCGGQQWVNETVFQCGSLKERTKKIRRAKEKGEGNAGQAARVDTAHVDTAQDEHLDLDYVQSILAVIEKEDLPAPCPIEQRWTASSSAEMSPANGKTNAAHGMDTLHSWVGIIMYVHTLSCTCIYTLLVLSCMCA
jgi:L-galactono-1,4-lactone dehydrogenase